MNTPKHVTDLTTVTQMPSKSNCNNMLHLLTAGKCKGISCLLGTFNKSAVETLLKIHALRDIAARVKQERWWLNQAVKSPNEYCLLPNGLLDEYEKLLFDNSDGKVVLNKTILASDLATLTGSNWLNLSVIQGVLDLVNNQSSGSCQAFLLNNLIGLTGSQLQGLVGRKDDKQLKFLTFIVNVGGNITETFVGTPHKPGCHWTLLYIDTTVNKWLYCDTLGWALPKDLPEVVNHILLEFSKKVMILKKPAQGRFLAHKENLNSRSLHRCTNQCFKNIPLQTCGNICGAIATILGAISCTDDVLWRCGFLSNKVPLPEPIAWLKEPTKHAAYLRLVLIHWLMAKQVDLKLLGITNSSHFQVLRQSTPTAAESHQQKHQTGVAQTAADATSQEKHAAPGVPLTQRCI